MTLQAESPDYLILAFCLHVHLSVLQVQAAIQGCGNFCNILYLSALSSFAWISCWLRILTSDYVIIYYKIKQNKQKLPHSLIFCLYSFFAQPPFSLLTVYFLIQHKAGILLWNQRKSIGLLTGITLNSKLIQRELSFPAILHLSG